MTEALFYHLETRSLDDVLPGLIERTRERGWKALIKVGSAERMQALDTHLWTYSEQSFLAHGTAADGHDSRQPVYLTTEEANPNRAEVLFLVGGATPDDWAAVGTKDFARIVLIFEGRDANALASARAAWTDARDAGLDTTYWKESPSGKWEKQG
jgi:DNA polymerase-3 subunit chi